MPTKRGVALFGARAAAGIVGVAAAVLAAGAVVVLPWPTVAARPASVVVSPVPSEQKLVCPGPLLTLAEDSSKAQAATSVGRAQAVYGARASAADPGGVSVSEKGMSALDNSAADRDGAPLLLRVPAVEGATTPALVAGSQSQTADGETLAGLAVAACGEATGDAWLVGGSTDIGRTSLILLSNPTTVLATVDLTVFGETGVVDAPGAAGILVQPGAQRIISLAGLAPNLKSPVVHVQSHGGQVAAALEQSVIVGINPGGVELLGPSAGPALEQTIAGVLVASKSSAGAANDADAVPDDVPSVRLMAPGDEPATVKIDVTSETGPAAGTSVQVDLQPGIATEVPLQGLAPGSYAVRLASDRPIVAAARAAVAGTDFAWYAASEARGGDFMVSVASGPGPVLHLFNTDTKDAALTLTPEGGQAAMVSVPAGGSAVLALESGARYVVTGGSAIVASVSYSGGGLLSSFALSPAGPLAAPITVYAR
jgi:hypothetical protein